MSNLKERLSTRIKVFKIIEKGYDELAYPIPLELTKEQARELHRELLKDDPMTVVIPQKTMYKQWYLVQF